MRWGGKEKTITRHITCVLRYNPLKCSNQLGILIKSLLSSIFNYSSREGKKRSQDYADMDQIPLSDFPRSPKLFLQHCYNKSFTRSMVQSKHAGCLFHWRNHVVPKEGKTCQNRSLSSCFLWEAAEKPFSIPRDWRELFPHPFWIILPTNGVFIWKRLLEVSKLQTPQN